MNKQEAIEKIEGSLMYEITMHIGKAVNIYDVIDIVKQIDEPEKQVVPQFVADWVANSREYDYEFCDFFDCNYQSEEVYRWLKCENRRQSELNSLALSTLVVHGRDAVIVEQEKLYTVELPNPNAGGHVVLCKTSDGIVSIAFAGMAHWKGGKNFQLTESEIKEDFEWAWQFAKEVEE